LTDFRYPAEKISIAAPDPQRLKIQELLEFRCKSPLFTVPFAQTLKNCIDNEVVLVSLHHLPLVNLQDVLFALSKASRACFIVGSLAALNGNMEYEKLLVAFEGREKELIIVENEGYGKEVAGEVKGKSKGKSPKKGKSKNKGKEKTDEDFTDKFFKNASELGAYVYEKTKEIVSKMRG
jgi:hypothetical protein